MQVISSVLNRLRHAVQLGVLSTVLVQCIALNYVLRALGYVIVRMKVGDLVIGKLEIEG